MRIVSLNPDPILEFAYRNAGHGPGGFEEVRLPVLEAAVDHLAESVEAIVATGDLQGRERFEDAGGSPLRLLGEVLPGWLAETLFARDGYPRPDQDGVWLAGDLYTAPALDRRGGTGWSSTRRSRIVSAYPSPARLAMASAAALRSAGDVELKCRTSSGTSRSVPVSPRPRSATGTWLPFDRARR